jgi:hypothetical protein
VLAIRFARVEITRPRNSVPQNLPDTVALTVVDVREVTLPATGGVHWRLLTTHTVDSLADALVMVDSYRRRWTIEQVFRTLKSAGKAVEASQVPEAGRFVKLATAALIAAVRTMQLVMARDGTTAQPLSDGADTRDLPMLHAVCAKVEGRTAALKNPHAPDTLAWLADLTRADALPQKLLILHQFQVRMVVDRERLDTSRDELAIMVHVDGQGGQAAKQDTWNVLHRDAPAPLYWGWKNFYDEDQPMLTPEETVAQVLPTPELVTYQ